MVNAEAKNEIEKLPKEVKEFIEKFEATTKEVKKRLERNMERICEFGKEKILKYWAPPIFVYRSKKHPEIITAFVDTDKTKRYEDRVMRESGGMVADFLSGWEKRLSEFIASTRGEDPEVTELEMWIIRSIFVERPDKLLEIGGRWSEKWAEAVIERAEEARKIAEKLKKRGITW